MLKIVIVTRMSLSRAMHGAIAEGQFQYTIATETYEMDTHYSEAAMNTSV